MTRQKLWTRSFVIITLEFFLISMNFYLLMTVVSKFAIDRFGASTALGGLSASIFVIGGLAARPLSGKWIHRAGQMRTLYAGAFLSLVMTLLYFAVNSTALLLLIRLLHGAAFGVTTVATGTIIAGIVPRERYGEGIGYFALGSTMAIAIGPFIGLLLIQHDNFASVIIACSIASGIGLFMLPLLSVRELQLTEEQVEDARRFKLGNLVELHVVPISVTLLLAYLCYGGVVSFLALYSKQIKLTGAASLFFVVFAAAVFITRPFMGRRLDAKGDNSVMYPAFLAFAVSLAIFSQARSDYMLLLAAALMGLGFGALQSSSQAITVKITPEHRMGLATSTRLMFMDMGSGVGPLLWGLVIPFAGYRGMYVAVTIVAAGCLVLYYALYGKKAAAQN